MKPSRSDYAPVNGTRLYFEINGAGPPLVLIHGFSLDYRMWDSQMAPFTENFQVIRYDLRGFGRSDQPAEAPYAHYEDLRALLTYLGIERANIVALSLGGLVALDFVLAYPESVEKLVLVDTIMNGYQWSDDWKESVREIWRNGRRGQVDTAKSLWLNHPLFAPACQNPGSKTLLRQIITDYSGWHYANRDPAFSLEPATIDRLNEIKAPILVIIGQLDLPDYHTMATIIANDIEGARQVVIPGAGHLSNMEAPEIFNDLVLQFLDF